jgi:hypothetical protein
VSLETKCQAIYHIQTIHETTRFKQNTPMANCQNILELLAMMLFSIDIIDLNVDGLYTTIVQLSRLTRVIKF